jgi:hypothetical protein
MATYTTNGGIKLIATGDESGTWGSSTNTNFDIIDVLTNGVGTIDLTSAAGAYTLTTTNGVVSPGMDKVLIFTNATQAVTVTIAPDDAEKLYCVKNSTSYTLSFKQTASGTPVDVAAGKTAIIAADGGGSSAVVTEIVGATSLGATFLQKSENLNDLASSETARLNLGLGDAAIATIGTSGGVQAYDAGLTSIADLTTAANKMIYTTGSDTYAVTDLTAAGRALLDDADAAAQRTTLELGTLAIASSINNDNWSGADLAVANGGTGISTVPTNGQLLIGNGSGYTQATLTEGDNITITNTSGGIELDVVRSTTVGDDFSNSVRDAYLNLTGGNTTSQVSTTNYGIGTYILAWDVLSGSDVFPGQTATGGGLNAFGVTNGGLTYIDGQRRRADGWAQWNYDYTHTGTWRCMGYAEDYYNTGGGGSGVGTLWIRIL